MRRQTSGDPYIRKAIYIGSYEVSIKIFEISERRKSVTSIISGAGSSSEEMHIPREVSDMNLWRRCVIRLPSTKRSWTATGWTVTKRMLPQP